MNKEDLQRSIQIYESRLADEESFKTMNDHCGSLCAVRHKSFLRRKIREQKKLLEELEGGCRLMFEFIGLVLAGNDGRIGEFQK